MGTTEKDFGELMEERRKRECIKKMPFESIQQAAAARRKMERNHKGQYFTEYYCMFCGKYHIGHTRNQHWR